MSHATPKTSRPMRRLARVIPGAIGVTLAASVGVALPSVAAPPAALVKVGDAATLARAIAELRGGEQVVLAPGRYRMLAIARRQFDTPVTFRSADPARPAIIERLTVQDAAGIVFRQLEFIADPKQSGTHNVVNSAGIRFERLYVHGSLDDNPGNDAAPFLLRNSRDIVVANSQFRELKNGIGFLGGERLRFTGNRFVRMRSDGVLGGGASHVRVDGNVFASFSPAPGDHPDGIQFWTANTTRPVRDIRIEGNLVHRGRGDLIQGIFVRDTQALPFEQVVIRNNLLVGTMWHAISVDGVRGAELRGNEVVPFSDQRAWIRVKSGRDVRIEGNRSPEILSEASRAVTLAGNRKTAAVRDRGAGAVRAWLAGRDRDGRLSAAARWAGLFDLAPG